MNDKLKRSWALLIVYLVITLCITLFCRDTVENGYISKELFWGYKSSDPAIRYGDNFFNILLFVPIGILAGIITPKHKILLATLLGLFLSETIECSQLIWKLGTFDVDDLFNNTVGAFVGALIVCLFGLKN